MREFDDCDDLMAFCEDVWGDGTSPGVLEDLADSDYALGDFGLGEEDELPDLGLAELFWEHSRMYMVLGEERQQFDAGFPLFRVLAAGHPRTEPETLARLGTAPDPEVLWAVASNPNTPQEVLGALAGSPAVIETGLQGRADPWPDDDDPLGIRFGTGQPWELEHVPVAAAVAGNRAISPELTDWFVHGDHPDFAKAVILRNSDRLSGTQWRRLFEGAMARDRENAGWLQWMAMSPDLPQEFYAGILRDPVEGPILARRLASLLNTSSETLMMVIATAPDAWTRAHIASHPHASAQLRAELSTDPDPQVREAAMGTPRGSAKS